MRDVELCLVTSVPKVPKTPANRSTIILHVIRYDIVNFSWFSV